MENVRSRSLGPGQLEEDRWTRSGRPLRSTSHSRQRSGSACTTSMGLRLRAVCRRAARSAARPRAWAPRAAAIRARACSCAGRPRARSAHHRFLRLPGRDFRR